MPSYLAIRRYYLLYDKLCSSRFPSFQELRDWFRENDCDISTRTLQRDLMRMRYDYGIEIAYNKTENGYFIDNELSVKPDVFLRFLEVIATAEMFTESLRKSSDILRHIHFDAKGGMRGIELLPKILKAIQESRQIHFIHFNFFTGKERKYSLQPYFIKEYLNRWYVIGKPYPFNDFLTFGIDRIHSLEISKDGFERGDEKPEEIFDHVIGIIWNPYHVETIRFSYDKPYDNYVRTLPLHSSQRIVGEDEEQTTFEIDVVSNHELIQRFLMIAAECEVLAPDHLRRKIRKSLKTGIKRYK
jgi:predicted DNA-binding transcriptional regulator YafY